MIAVKTLAEKRQELAEYHVRAFALNIHTYIIRIFRGSSIGKTTTPPTGWMALDAHEEKEGRLEVEFCTLI